ncbi:MAG TPA: hypothetical protein VKA44_01885 [Gemmatimonadota bacterium]|nr:hypothetical protein [Gemmatimonadota bacterium]
MSAPAFPLPEFDRQMASTSPLLDIPLPPIYGPTTDEGWGE